MSVSALRPPAPAASRGGLGARARAFFAPPTEIFNAHGKLENRPLRRLCVETAPREFRRTFFHSDSSGGEGGPGLGSPGAAAALQTPTASIRGVMGHLLGTTGVGGAPPTPPLPRRTRLLTRLLEEVWFPGHACQCLVASLFASLFAGKREAAPRDGARGHSARSSGAQAAA